MVHDKVLEFLRINGPSMPVEISTKIGYDSFVMRAVLLELINKGLIRKSNRPIGGSLVYFLPEHVNRMRQMIYDDLGIPDKKVLKTLKDQGQVLMSELSPHERAFIKRLLDFVSVKQQGSDYLVTYYSFNGQPKINPEPVKIEVKEPKPPEIKPINRELRLFDNTPKVKAKAAVDGFDQRVQNYLSIIGEITNVKKIKKTEYDYQLKINKPFEQELFVKAKKKNSINESDLSFVYAEALRQRKPALIVTTGKLTKKAEKWKKNNIGDLVKVVKLK